MIDLKGQIAIVTGAGGGLGRSHARLLATRGAHVVVNDLGEGAERVASEIRDDGGSASSFAGSVTEAETMQAMADETAALRAGLGDMCNTVKTVHACDDVEQKLANATPFLDAFGHLVIAWMWLKQGLAIQARLDRGDDTPFERGKLRAMRYFYRHELPRTRHAFRLVRDLDRTCLDAGEDEF